EPPDLGPDLAFLISKPAPAAVADDPGKEPAPRRRVKPKKPNPLLVGGLVGGAALLVVLVVVAMLFTGPSSAPPPSSRAADKGQPAKTKEVAAPAKATNGKGANGKGTNGKGTNGKE